MTDSALAERHAIHIQRIYRGRLARRRAAALAGQVYVECYDPVSCLTYFVNQHSGTSSWTRPALLGNSPPQTNQNTAAAPEELVLINNSSNNNTSRTAKDKDGDAERAASRAFQERWHADRDRLELEQRQGARRARRRWDRQQMHNKETQRQERLDMLVRANRQRQQDLYEGRVVENVETIREAAMQGHVERVQQLLVTGFSANAESAMGLTPLAAACQAGHSDVVSLLLRAGADVTHQHVRTGRTALMEAASRTNVSIVRELLRYGAELWTRDALGETAFDTAATSAIQQVLQRANERWSPDNAALFPMPFRHVALALALVAKRQYQRFVQRNVELRRELPGLQQQYYRMFAEAKMRYDTDLKPCQSQVTLLKKLAAIDAVDARYDEERARILCLADASVQLVRASQTPDYLTPSVVCTILPYCDRMWFAPAASTTKAKTRSKHRRKGHRRQNSELAIQPTRARTPVTEIPAEVEHEWLECRARLERLTSELQEVERRERTDVESGVSRSVEDGTSQAVLEVSVPQARHLPPRDARTGEPVDPFVRAFLRPEQADDEIAPLFESDYRLADANPVWNARFVFHGVSSIKRELCVQIMDQRRLELAGECTVALRTLLDQKEHDCWVDLPPTLRQQVVEKKFPRKQPASVRLLLRFTHTKSILLTRELQSEIKVRDALVKRRRQATAATFQQLLDQLEQLRVNESK
ncbi:TPA: hypothetical protein N0F65_005974 [Lagenidium giganteum]|uniref:C2 domain-containing protein n=1 Tax=Lagenidium giganteum TaxID=4803 RepID=A0AAV2Z880_9STRA|nr:TPA: hypothetical protein N0F65_005974 [Lagenidium giganteum]